MLLIDVTFEVLKLLKSRFVRLLQPSNMLLIDVTFEVLKLLKSRFVRQLQFRNMYDESGGRYTVP